jgi:DnaD/phage-associated family protein
MSESKRVPSQKPLPRTIFRVVKNKDNPFVMIDKRPLENPELSWGAKGLLTYMLSRPDDWQFNTEDLIRRSSDGEYALRRLIKELRDAGHVQFAGRIPLGGVQGTRAIWNVYEEVPVRVEGSRARSDSRDEHLPVESVGHVVVSSSRKPRSTNNKDSTKIEEEEGAEKPKIQDLVPGGPTASGLGEAYTAFAQEIGVLTPYIADEVDEACQVHGVQWVIEAMKIASINGKRNWAYVKAILTRWKTEGYGSEGKRSGSRSNGKSLSASPAPSEEELKELRKLAEKELLK